MREFMKAILASLWLVAACAPASADTLNAPAVKTGDTWTYRVTTDKVTSGWGQTRDETLSFPLTVGKTWDLQYTEPHPTKTFRSEEWTIKFTVVGYESVEVPAGKYNALKIEAEGRWTAELEPAQTVMQGALSNAEGTTMSTQVQKVNQRTVTGRTYKAFWYVPEVKRWVKSVEEYYGDGGVRNESYTGELELFRVD